MLVFFYKYKRQLMDHLPINSVQASTPRHALSATVPFKFTHVASVILVPKQLSTPIDPMEPSHTPSQPPGMQLASVAGQPTVGAGTGIVDGRYVGSSVRKLGEPVDGVGGGVGVGAGVGLVGISVSIVEVYEGYGVGSSVTIGM